MSAVNVGELIGGWKSSGMKMGGRMLGRGIRNTEMLSAMARDNGWKAAARTLGGPAGAGAMKGAMIGAGLGAGMSMINDATNNNFNTGSIGRGVGGALRGGLIGGAVGGVGGLGNAMFRGNVNRIAAAQAKAAAGAAAPKAASMGRMARVKEFMTRRRGLNDLTGLGRANPTMGNARAARREVYGTWSQRNVPTFSGIGSRLGLTARNFTDDVRRMRATPSAFTKPRGGSNLTRNFSMNANNYDNVGVHLHQINPGTISPVGTSRVALGRPASVNGGGMVGMMPNRQPEVIGLMYPSSMFHRNPSAMRYLE